MVKDFMLIDAVYTGNVAMSKDTLEYCSKFKVIALYASVQCSGKLDPVIEQLKAVGVKVISSKPTRTAANFQILGCDMYRENLKLEEEPDAFLYIGDGMFHPEALLLAQKDDVKMKEVIRYNPMIGKYDVLGVKDLERMIKRYKGSLLKFLGADKEGVIVTTKPGQIQLNQGKQLPEKYPDKRFYYFLGGTIDLGDLENFNFIKMWVNTACPRIATADDLEVSMININDALSADVILSKESLLTKA